MSFDTSSDDPATPITGDQFAQLMSAISTTHECLDDKLFVFHEELQQGQEDTAAKALKWVCREKPSRKAMKNRACSVCGVHSRPLLPVPVK